MWVEVSHTADIAFDIYFSSIDELFRDIISLLRERIDCKFKDETKEEIYGLSGEIEDDIFDITNDMIYNVDSGWVPVGMHVDGDSLKVLYKKAELKEFDVKALTYHQLKVKNLKDGRKLVRVVFDI